MRYQRLRPELSEQITAAGSDVQRQIVRALVTLVTERAAPQRTSEAVAALNSAAYGDTELRTWLHQETAAATSSYNRLWGQQQRADQSGEPWTGEQESQLQQAHTRAAVYDLLHASLDPNPHHAAQEAAFLARKTITDDETDTAIGWLLREAGFDVTDSVYWLPPTR